MPRKNSDPDKALDVIGEKLRIKEEIDRDFDELELKSEETEIVEPDQIDPRRESVHYAIPYKDFGLNVFSNLNLGKAYKLVGGDEAEPAEYNIPEDAKREKNTIYDKEAMDEDWLDYLIAKVLCADNSFIILENIFSRVTTGNYETTLPYKEQLRYAYQKFNDPRLKGKILGLVRGVNEEEIIKNGGPDLMKKFGRMLGLEDRVLSNPVFKIDVKDPLAKGKTKTISIISVNQKTTATKGIFNIMQNFAKTYPGFDIYYNTTSKQNGRCVEMTSAVDEQGNDAKKSCYFLSFGPLFEYDKANINRPSLEPYTLNKAWYKVGVVNRIENGRVVSSVRADYEDYIYPHVIKKDVSNFTAAIIGDEIKELLDGQKDRCLEAIDKSIETLVIKSRNDLGHYIKYGKQKEKGE